MEREQIVSINNKLNRKKPNGYDGISIAMLKLCPIEVSIPLSLIFDKCLHTGIFPFFWKKGNVQPVHKKDSRQIKTNYRPISLLPICSKIFEKIIFDQMYTFFVTSNLLSKNQSGFIPGDSTINQLLAITAEILMHLKTLTKLEQSSSIFQRLSIRCGMKGSVLN